MAKFTDYTEKTEPVDTDLALIYDTQAKVNKKFTYGNLWKWIAKKIVSEGISQLDTTNKTIPGAINELNSNVKYGNIKYIDCGGYGTLATFSIGKLLYCKFNGVDKVSEVKQQNIAQLPSEYTLNSSIGVYMSALVRDQNTGSLQISTDGKITLYCPYPYLYGYMIMPIK